MLFIHPTYLSGRIEIDKDEIVGLVGKNGSGKTTLILSALCLSDKQSLTIVDGEEFCKMRDYSKFSAVFQDPNSQRLANNCKEEIELMKRFHIVNENIVKKIMDKYYEKDFNTLSDGYKRRYVISTILASNPKYILLDEPFANLDEEGIGIVKEILPKNSLIAEHRIEEIRNIVNRVYLIKENREVREIDKSKLFDENFLKNEGLRGFKLPKISNKLGDKVLLDIEVNGYKIRVRESEIVCLLGKNGAGKTTLLKKLSSKIFVIFQDLDLQFFYFTVRELLNNNKLVSNIFKLEPLMDKSPFILSFGQKMKVLIASAFSSNYNVIGLDEPSVGMDGETLLSFYEMMELVKEDKRGVIIATHDKDIISLCDTKVFINNEARARRDSNPGPTGISTSH
ncbi:ABC transporter ATP-binding protein [Sulfolobus sp. A20-N-F6]|nr:ABC transporter ATP-binding protein [Sulfolobus sp. B5]TRM77817.1 ABC transporter ATP-binding protein [Sulfolobus sp. A20-N-F8]TRM81941.1 ABC transporter ATP-binding protein [Sulfolobus sp. A20-N-F6]TRM87547.1 ABC transporter ATP-binding protein [Sulfolobus sp. C3]